MEIRVTKYNPAYRDANGCYDVNIDEWTEYQHIGQVFNGKEFTYEEYVEMENKYKSAIRVFLSEYNCITIAIKEIDTIKNVTMLLDEKEKSFSKTLNKIEKTSMISSNEIDDAACLILRGFYWGVWYKLEDPGVCVRFGYDFYMYFEAPEIRQSLITKVESIGLYVD